MWGRPVFIHSLAKLHPLPPVDVAPANRATQHASFVELNAPVQYQSCIDIRQQGNAANNSRRGLSDNFGSAWKTLLVLLIAFWRGAALNRATTDNAAAILDRSRQPRLSDACTALKLSPFLSESTIGRFCGYVVAARHLDATHAM